MKIKLYQGSTLTDATVAMIKSIDNSDMFSMHVIIVPDRFSLQCEKLVLQLFPQKALFNVRVVTLTRFSVELLSKLGVKLGKGDVLSSGETLLLTSRAIENVQENFKTFKRGGIDFCYEISKLISQFKSSGVAPEQLNSSAGGMTGNKYHDLSLIYNEYEKLLGDKLDANARLSLLNEKLKSSKILSDTKIYFAQFDAFTKGGFNLIETFAECADEVNISFTASQSIGNDYIYEKDIYEKIIKLSTEKGINIDVEKKQALLSPQKEAIVKGLYSYQKVKCENKGFYNLYSCSSKAEEVEAVAKFIRYLVFKGARYSDIQIAVGSLAKEQSQIENIFSQYNIPFYIDTSVTADKTILGNLVRSYFETAIMGYGFDKLVDLLANPLANNDVSLIEKCQHLSIDGKHRYKKYIEKDFENATILSRLEKCKNAKDFSEVIDEILSKAKTANDQMLKKLEESFELKEKNINIQTADIIRETTELITREICGEIGIGEYYKLLNLLLSFKQVSTVPTFVDGVFVGDATESYFAESNVLVIMGGENLPVVSTDNGLLTDEDIKVNFASPIEPTIRMLNRRKRFKLFSLLSQAKEKLFIFCQRLDEEGKKKELPTYIKNLNEIFSQQELRAGSIFFSNKSKDKNIKLLSSPLRQKIEKSDTSYLQRNTISNLGELVFKDNKARVTQIEQYFSCPFKHFATYGLKLKEFEIDKFQPRDIGNICHKGAELLLEDIIKNDSLKNFDKNKIVEFIDKNFNKIIKLENLREKLDEAVEKDILIKFIKNQMTVLFEDIVKELNLSSFKPSKLEYKFDNCKVGRSDISLIGKADRIDECGEYFRIIDYKTGSTGNILKELMFGRKLQLFLYQKFAKENLAKEIGGVFYFDAKFNYDKDDQGSVLLKGYLPNDDNLIRLVDSNIEIYGKSDIVSVYKSKKDGSYKGSAISKVEMERLSAYAEKVTERAIEEILGGYIQPKPHVESCKGCKFASLCGYEREKGVRKLEKK